MGMFNGQGSATVLLADLHDDRVVIRRQNVVYGERIAEDWVLPLPVIGNVWSFESRRNSVCGPQFPPGAAVTVSRRTGVNRLGKSEFQVVLSFPRALASARNALVEKYRITVTTAGRDVLTREVFAQRHFLCEERVASLVKEEKCVFGADEIPPGAVFKVRPLDEWGHAGREIVSPASVV